MTTTKPTLPTRENPRYVGNHRFYYHADAVVVIVYGGPLEVHELDEIITLVASSERRLLATVADVKNLASFGPHTRKLLLSDRVTEILQGDPKPLSVFVVNADVVRRAIVKLATIAARLLSKRQQRMYFMNSLEEAEERAAAYHASIISQAEDPASDAPG